MVEENKQQLKEACFETKKDQFKVNIHVKCH